MNEHVKNVCKIGQGRACCRYLSADQNGLGCEKLGPLKDRLDRAIHMTARGDNCDGLAEDEWKLLRSDEIAA